MIAATHASPTAAGSGRRAWLPGNGVRTALLLAPLCFSGFARADEARVDGLKVVEAGVFEAVTFKKEFADTPSGVVLWQKDVRLLKSTTFVCPKPGVVFGLRYAIEGAPLGAPVEIVVRVNFPAPGVQYPGAKTKQMYAEQAYTRDIGVVRFSDYTIGGYWDALPGHWSIQFWTQGRLVAEEGFDLNKSACRVGA
jgi:hypothetical protein